MSQYVLRARELLLLDLHAKWHESFLRGELDGYIILGQGSEKFIEGLGRSSQRGTDIFAKQT